MGATSHGERDHRDSPAAKAYRREGLALGVEIGDETGGNVPVAAQVEVLEGVHGEVLQVEDGKVRSEEMQVNEGPVELAGGLVARLMGSGDGVVEEASEGGARVQPLNEEGEHGRRLARQP